MALRSSGTPTGQTVVTFGNAMADANYHVSYAFTSDTDFGPHHYLYITSKTPTGFTFILNSSSGDATNAPAGTTADWIAVPTN